MLQYSNTATLTTTTTAGTATPKKFQGKVALTRRKKLLLFFWNVFLCIIDEYWQLKNNNNE